MFVMRSIGETVKIIRERKGLSQAELARRIKKKAQNIQQLESGLVGHPRYLGALAKELGTTVERLELGDTSTDDDFPRTPSEDDFVRIKQYDASGSCGPGALNGHVEVRGELAFKREWVQKLGVKADDCVAIYTAGDSMAPRIIDGDVVLIDQSQKEPKHNKVFALQVGEDTRLKRLYQNTTGEWVLKSDSSDKVSHPDEPVSSLDALHIIGRVVWVGGEM